MFLLHQEDYALLLPLLPAFSRRVNENFAHKDITNYVLLEGQCKNWHENTRSRPVPLLHLVQSQNGIQTCTCAHTTPPCVQARLLVVERDQLASSCIFIVSVRNPKGMFGVGYEHWYEGYFGGRTDITEVPGSRYIPRSYRTLRECLVGNRARIYRTKPSN